MTVALLFESLYTGQCLVALPHALIEGRNIHDLEWRTKGKSIPMNHAWSIFSSADATSCKDNDVNLAPFAELMYPSSNTGKGSLEVSETLMPGPRTSVLGPTHITAICVSWTMKQLS